MKCGHDDCFTCPYPDCIHDENKKTITAHKKHAYYEAHKEYRLKWQKQYAETHREQIKQYSRNRWENMSEEEKEKERARQREYYYRKKAKMAMGGSNV